MDDYTRETRDWLNGRFRSAGPDGVYRSHAPVYGFSSGHYALGIYKNNYAVLREAAALCREYEIRTLLEVGCAEGFTASLLRDLFGFRTAVCDLSGEAVARAKELYGLEGFEADVQSMPEVPDGAYDLVVCSETLEHVPDPEHGFAELLRVARKALVVTVPAAVDEAEKAGFRPPPGPHTHLRIFTREELVKYTGGGRVRPVCGRLQDRLDGLLTGEGAGASPRRPLAAAAHGAARRLAAPARACYGPRLAALLVRLDHAFCGAFPCAAHTYLAAARKAPPDGSCAHPAARRMLDHMLNGHRAAPLRLSLE